MKYSKQTLLIISLIISLINGIKAQNSIPVIDYKKYCYRMLNAAETGNKKEFESNFRTFQQLMPITKNAEALSDSVIYYYGLGLYFADQFSTKGEINKDVYSRALPYIKNCANRGNYDCYFLLGTTTTEIDKALNYYLLASKGKTFKKYSLAAIASIYEEKNDTANAIKYYQFASDVGNYNSSIRLGYLYLNVEIDLKLALEYFKIAESQLDPKDLVSKWQINSALGLLYINEKIGNENYNEEKGLSFLKKSLIFGNEFYRMINASSKLKDFDSFSEFDISKLSENEKKQLDSASKVIDITNQTYLYLIADIYQNPKKISANIDSSIYYYTLCSSYYKDTSAALSLGDIYSNSTNYKLGQNYIDSAIKYYEIVMRNAKNVHFSVPEILGDLYYSKIDSYTPFKSVFLTDYDIAFIYNNHAIEKGSLRAYLQQGNLHRKKLLYKNTINKDSALYYYNTALRLAKNKFNKEIELASIIEYASFVENFNLSSRNYDIAFNMLLTNQNINNLGINYWLYVYYKNGYGMKKPDRRLAQYYLIKYAQLGGVLNSSDELFMKMK